MVNKLWAFFLAASVLVVTLCTFCNAVDVTFRERARPSSLSIAGVRQVMTAIANLINHIDVDELYRGGRSISHAFTVGNARMTISLFFFNRVNSISGFCSVNPVWDQVMRGQEMVDIFSEIYQQIARSALEGFYGRIQAVSGSLEIAYSVHQNTGPSSLADSFAIKDSSNSTMFKPEEQHNASSHLDDEIPCWVYSYCLISGEDGALGSYLAAGASLVSPNGNYALIMQEDCNLVLYDISGGTYVVIWASGTQGKGVGCYCNLQLDANLVIFDYTGRVVWATNVYCQPQPNCVMMAGLVVEDDGKATIFDTDRTRPIWRVP